MKILKCPKCGTLHPVDQKASCLLCGCHNPAVYVIASLHCIGTLRRRKVRQAERLAKDYNMDLSRLLREAMELKSYG